MAIGAPKELSALRRFFLEPRLPKHRQYEALRAYLLEGRLAKDVARAFGYTLNSFHVLCHHFRRETHPSFFLSARHGPQSQPKKSAARDLIVKLRKQNHYVYEISLILKDRHSQMSPACVNSSKPKGSLRCLGGSMKNGPSNPAPRLSQWPMPECFPWPPAPSPLAAAGCSCS